MSSAPKSVPDLNERLSEPTDGLVEDLHAVAGDMMVLGAGGKMGPTLSRMARKALDRLGRHSNEVYAVSRWSDSALAEDLARQRIHVIATDLESPDGLRSLPEAENIIYMVGAKFGSTGDPAQMWHINTTLPAQVAARFPSATFAALSTGNVYPMVATTGGGSVESDTLGPVGEYAMSCVGRERAFQHAAARFGTRAALIRLNYAVDLRYGILCDVATSILQGEPVDVTTATVNVVWQRYANEVVIRSLRHAESDPFIVNVTGPEVAPVQRLARLLAQYLDAPVEFTGEPAPTALLSDASLCHQLFGYPEVPLRKLIDWQAEWIRSGLPLSGKPTKFTVRDGRF